MLLRKKEWDPYPVSKSLEKTYQLTNRLFDSINPDTAKVIQLILYIDKDPGNNLHIPNPKNFHNQPTDPFEELYTKANYQVIA